MARHIVLVATLIAASTAASAEVWRLYILPPYQSKPTHYASFDSEAGNFVIDGMTQNQHRCLSLADQFRQEGANRNPTSRYWCEKVED
jgi:hypothetical protein